MSYPKQDQEPRVLFRLPKHEFFVSVKRGTDSVSWIVDSKDLACMGLVGDCDYIDNLLPWKK